MYHTGSGENSTTSIFIALRGVQCTTRIITEVPMKPYSPVLPIVKVAGRHIPVLFADVNQCFPFRSDNLLLFLSEEFAAHADWYSSLELSALDRITVFGDRDSIVPEASARTGVACDLIEENGLVLAGPLGCELLVNADVGLSFTPNTRNPAKERYAIVLIRHELRHVEDFARNKLLWGHAFPRQAFKGLRNTSMSLALPLWQEFYADRGSCDALDQIPVYRTETNLLEHIVWWQEAVKAGPAQALAEHGQGLIGMMRKSCALLGYVLGSEHARTDPRSSEHPLSLAMREIGWTELVERARATLITLHATMPWQDKDCLFDLEEICVAMFEKCGFVLSEDLLGKVTCTPAA